MAYEACTYPGCSSYFYHHSKLLEHYRDVHGINQPSTSGYFESQRESKTGDMKALEHQLIAEISKAKEVYKDTARTPIQANIPIPPPPKQKIKPPSPWTYGGSEGTFQLYVDLGTITNSFDSVTKYLKGTVDNHHAILHLHTVRKNLEEIQELERKHSELTSRISGFTISDPSFLSIVQGIQDTKNRLHKARQENYPDENIERILEEFNRTNELGSDECDKWKMDFMNKCIAEIQRISKPHREEDDNFKRNKGE